MCTVFICPYFVCVSVCPDLAVDPGPGHHPFVLIVQTLRPLSSVDGRQKPSPRVADVHFSVLATGRPHHGTSQHVVLDMEGELPVVIIDLPYSGALVKVYGQKVPVVCL